MKVHGRCHCGAIAYEAEVDPATVGVCHCTDCQVLTGSAYRVSAPAPAESFVITGAAPTEYVKTADSGRRRRHAFCPKCGAPIYATAADGERTTYSLRVGALDERALLPPRRRIWARSALAWSADLSAVPAREGQ